MDLEGLSDSAVTEKEQAPRWKEDNSRKDRVGPKQE